MPPRKTNEVKSANHSNLLESLEAVKAEVAKIKEAINTKQETKAQLRSRKVSATIVSIDARLHVKIALKRMHLVQRVKEEYYHLKRDFCYGTVFSWISF